MTALATDFALDLPAGRSVPPATGVWSVAAAFVLALWGSISRAHLTLALPDEELRRLSAELSEASNGYAGDVAGATRRFLHATTR